MLPRATKGMVIVAATVLVLCGPAAPLARATLMGFSNVTGANDAIITDTPPNPVAPNPNDGILLAWDEVQNHQLTTNLAVDRVADPSADFIEPDGHGGYLIKAGTIVSSHYLQWDPGAGSSSRVQATIHFDSDIFAFITADQKMFDSDSILGLPELDYSDFLNRGLEGADTTNIRGSEVDIDWTASSPGDWTRLITAFSPTAAYPELTTNNDPENPAVVDFGNVRVATTGTAALGIRNDGDFGSNLSGDVPAPAAGVFALVDATAFGPLGMGETATKTYSYAPTVRGPESEAIGEITGDDTPDADAPVTLQGVGVGPVFDSDPLAGGAIDLGQIDKDDQAALTLEITNETDDGGGADLTDLTLVSLAVTGPGADKFALSGLVDGARIEVGQTADLQITFDPDGELGEFEAVLTLYTDEGAPLGGDGADYSYPLAGTSVPEPATVALLALGSVVALRPRRKKGRATA